MREDGHAGDGGEHCFEALHLFPDEFGGQGGQSGDVATGPGEAGDEAAPHRIAHTCHHKGDRRGRVLGGKGCWGPLRYDDIRLELDQLGREVGEVLEPPLCIAVLQDEVLAFDIAERAHPLQESRHQWVSS